MTRLAWLAPGEAFPPTDRALQEPNGLLAAGGDLSVDTLAAAYRQGIFPWYEDGQPILWWSPAPRAVLFPERFHCSRSLRKLIRQQRYQVTLDTCFAAVIAACASPREHSDGTWITQDIQDAYAALHRAGLAHSVEVWQEGQLVGGLYGVALGRVFFGESMFAWRDNASKAGFAWLMAQLKHWGFALVDCQMSTGHLASLGAELIQREAFEAILRNNTGIDPHGVPLPWRFDIQTGDVVGATP